jgi:hypothetical protein
MEFCTAIRSELSLVKYHMQSSLKHNMALLVLILTSCSVHQSFTNWNLKVNEILVVVSLSKYTLLCMNSYVNFKNSHISNLLEYFNPTYLIKSSDTLCIVIQSKQVLHTCIFSSHPKLLVSQCHMQRGVLGSTNYCHQEIWRCMELCCCDTLVEHY